MIRAFLLLFAVMAGCARPIPPAQDMATALQKMEDICRQELNIKPVIILKWKTLHLYLPITSNLFKFKPGEKPPRGSKEKGQRQQINFFETTFKGQTIAISYDISLINIYPKNPSPMTAYTDELSKINTGLLTAIHRSLGDLNTEDSPDFIVLLIANITDGVGIKTIFHSIDLKRHLEQSLPQEEFILRYMTEMTGGTTLINNTTGKGLEFEEITWPEFIAKQITHRINFKYTQSSFPPTGNDIDEILAAVQAAIQAYDFKDVKGIELTDLKNGDRHSFPIK